MKKLLLSVFAMVLAFGVINVSAQKMENDDKMKMSSDTVMVGGEAMYRMKNIVENAVNSKEHTTLVAAVKAAGLVETLSKQRSFHGFCSGQ